MDKKDIVLILYDHYKDSCNIVRKNLEKRDLYTAYVLISFFILLLFDIEPSFSFNIANQLLGKSLGINIHINYIFFPPIILIIFLFIIVKYFQISVSIERQYSYIHSLENKVNTLSECEFITREGKSYLKKYPLLLNLIHWFYNIIMPSIIILMMLFKIYVFYLIVMITGLKAIDILICIIIIIFNIAYIRFRYKYS